MLRLFFFQHICATSIKAAHFHQPQLQLFVLLIGGEVVVKAAGWLEPLAATDSHICSPKVLTVPPHEQSLVGVWFCPPVAVGEVFTTGF